MQGQKRLRNQGAIISENERAAQAWQGLQQQRGPKSVEQCEGVNLLMRLSTELH